MNINYLVRYGRPPLKRTFQNLETNKLDWAESLIF